MMHWQTTRHPRRVRHHSRQAGWYGLDPIRASDLASHTNTLLCSFLSPFPPRRNWQVAEEPITFTTYRVTPITYPVRHRAAIPANLPICTPDLSFSFNRYKGHLALLPEYLQYAEAPRLGVIARRIRGRRPAAAPHRVDLSVALPRHPFGHPADPPVPRRGWHHRA